MIDQAISITYLNSKVPMYLETPRKYIHKVLQWVTCQVFRSCQCQDKKYAVEHVSNIILNMNNRPYYFGNKGSGKVAMDVQLTILGRKIAGVTAAAFPLSRARLGKVSTWLEYSITMNMTMFVSKHCESLLFSRSRRISVVNEGYS